MKSFFLKEVSKIINNEEILNKMGEEGYRKDVKIIIDKFVIWKIEGTLYYTDRESKQELVYYKYKDYLTEI